MSLLVNFFLFFFKRIFNLFFFFFIPIYFYKGGSICMDLLTMSGWKPIYTLDQVILQIRTEMGHGGGNLTFISFFFYFFLLYQIFFFRSFGYWKPTTLQC